MKYGKMTPEQMLFYIKSMDENYDRLCQSRDSLMKEVKAIQERKEILSWDEIASAIAFPKAASDPERIGRGNPDEYKLLHQAERINQLYRSQMEELFDELESVEMQITKYQYVSRCINKLEAKDKEVINLFTRKNTTFAKGEEILHMVRSTIYKMQRKALIRLTEIYNTGYSVS